MKKHIITFKNFILKEEVTPEYDSILDIYSRRKDKMTPTEKDFFNSGGKMGANFIHQLSDAVTLAIDKTMDYLDDNDIDWSIEETWAPSFGMLRYLSIDREPKVLHDIKRFFRGIPNDSLIPFVQEDDESSKIRVWLIEPSLYYDIVGSQIA